MGYVFVYAGLLFLFSMAVHIALWRAAPPRNRPLVLIALFLVLPFILISSIAAAAFSSPQMTERLGMLGAVYLLDFSLSIAYVLTYPAIEALSPSLLMLLIIGSSSEGVTREEICERFSEESLLVPRVRDLLDSGMIREAGPGYSLTPAASLMVGFFKAYRKVIGLPRGEG